MGDARARLARGRRRLDTTDFVYVRWMGERDLTRFDIVQRDRDANLERWAEAVERLRARVPAVYAYFSNFYEGHAPASANRLKRLLGQPIVDPELERISLRSFETLNDERGMMN